MSASKSLNQSAGSTVLLALSFFSGGCRQEDSDQQSDTPITVTSELELPPLVNCPPDERAYRIESPSGEIDPQLALSPEQVSKLNDAIYLLQISSTPSDPRITQLRRLPMMLMPPQLAAKANLEAAFTDFSVERRSADGKVSTSLQPTIVFQPQFFLLNTAEMAISIGHEARHSLRPSVPKGDKRSFYAEEAEVHELEIEDIERIRDILRRSDKIVVPSQEVLGRYEKTLDSAFSEAKQFHYHYKVRQGVYDLATGLEKLIKAQADPTFRQMFQKEREYLLALDQAPASTTPKLSSLRECLGRLELLIRNDRIEDQTSWDVLDHLNQTRADIASFERACK